MNSAGSRGREIVDAFAEAGFKAGFRDGRLDVITKSTAGFPWRGSWGSRARRGFSASEGSQGGVLRRGGVQGGIRGRQARRDNKVDSRLPVAGFSGF
jgi:hypothetical protein